MIAQLENLPLEYSPGEAWIYSVATDVVGYLVQIVSGQSYADFVRQTDPGAAEDDRHRFPGAAEAKRDRFTACYALKDGRLELFDDPKDQHSSRRPSWNPAAAAWPAPPPIICASAACC